MPVLDHFHPPLSVHRHWQGFHSTWTGTLARLLNEELLPPRFFAEPNVSLGVQVEIDVATFEESPRGAAGVGGVATAVWAPSRSAISVPVDLADLDAFEVRVMSDEEGPRLVAAIELVSPTNKDRPAHRRAFVTKCAAYLQQGVSVLVVDAVTSRPADMHRDLVAMLDLGPGAVWAAASGLSAVSYRIAGGARLEIWPEALGLGEPLPTLPLWLSEELAVPVDLERSYEATSRSLRISA